MDDSRKRIKDLLNKHLYLHFDSHESMMDPLLFQATLRLLDAKMDYVIDEITKILTSSSTSH